MILPAIETETPDPVPSGIDEYSEISCSTFAVFSYLYGVFMFLQCRRVFTLFQGFREGS
jgi:hypothetical protein